MGAGTPYVPAFTGTPTIALDYGSYYFNANHAGLVNFVDTTSGQTFSFGANAEAGGAEFRGSRINPGDPVVIIGEKQAAISSYAPFLNGMTVLFDVGGGGVAGGTLGVGFDAIDSQLVEHFDPETGTSLEGGGSIYFNMDNGYNSTLAPGFQIAPPGGGALICDYHGAVIEAPSFTDGTQAIDAAINGNWGCPLAPAHFEVASVLWGSANQNAFAMTTGGNGNANPGGGSLATTGKIVAPGNGAVAPTNVNLVSSTAVQHPQLTVTVTNKSAEPIDYSGISLSGGLTDVSIDPSSTCLTAGGNVPSNSLVGLSVITPGANICTIVLKDSGAQCTILGNAGCTRGPNASCTALHLQGATTQACCSGPGTGTCTAAPYACCTNVATGTCAGTETGTVTIAGNDHAFAPATLQNSTGIAIPVTCK